MRLTIVLVDGKYHAHAAGCRTPEREWADNGFIVDTEDRLRAARIAYADQIHEGSMTATEALVQIDFLSCAEGLPEGPVLASQFSTEDLETLVATAGELWDHYGASLDGDDVLSARQREVLDLAARL